MNRLSGRSLLILELAILLGFFVFSAVACSYMFVKASNKANDAEALNEAVVETISIAETLKAYDGSLNKTGARVGEGGAYEISNDILYVYLDYDMKPVSKSNQVYVASVSKSKDGKCNVYTIRISLSDDNSKVYELTFKNIRTGGAS